MNYINPCTTYISLSDLATTSDQSHYLENVETVGIFTEKNKGLVDYGCYAFSDRTIINGLTYVNPASLVPSRVYLLQNLLDDIGLSLRNKSKREVSVWNSVIRHLKPFFYWLDNESWIKSIHSDFYLEQLYDEYTDYLLEIKSKNTDNHDWTSRQQHAAKKFLSLASSTPKFVVGRGAPKLIRPISQPVSPPNESDVTANLSMAYQLFTQLSAFVLNKAPYPFELTIPKETVFILPCTTWTLNKSRLSTRDQMDSPNWCWDYRLGTLNTVEFVQKKYGYKPTIARRELARASNRLQKANVDFRHIRRMNLASLAQDAFQILILSATGVNLETLRDIPWNSDVISVPSERQGFRIFKARAGKEIYFEIQSSFIPLLNSYLKLRLFILNGLSCSLLFFRVYKGKALKIDDQFLPTYYDTIQKMLAPDLPRLTATEYRKYKANWVLDRKGPIVASLVAQNRLETFHKSYASSSKKNQQVEFTAFFSYITDLTQGAFHEEQKTPTGGCAGDKIPTDLIVGKGVEKNCKTYWGCLFCSNYVLHADNEDLYKLKSLEYCLTLIEHSSQNFTDALQETLDQAKAYISLILSESPELQSASDEIDKKLLDGTLYPYWQAYVDLWTLTGQI
ncbi:TPA: hypothetical protein U8251_002863 [Pseudomonas putida]|nr:hypothetical protein [Pseudomonas putida]